MKNNGKPPFVKVCGLTRETDARLALTHGARFLGFIFAAGTPRAVDIYEVRLILNQLKKDHHQTFDPVGVFLKESPDEIQAIATGLRLPFVQLHGPSSEYYFDPSFHELGFQPIPVAGIGESEDLSEVERIVEFMKSNDLKRDPESPDLLVDTTDKGQHGGTGKTFRHELVFPFLDKARIMIAGGLNPGNASQILDSFDKSESEQPFGFDLSSGLESEPRIKSPEKMAAFFEHFRQNREKKV